MAIEEIKLKSAGEFIAELQKTDPSWAAPDYRSPWVYRGHHDAGWELKPSAWRPDGQVKLKALKDWLRPQIEQVCNRVAEARHIKYMEKYVQTAAEIYAVHRFCGMSDELGLSIPESQKVYPLNHAIHWGIFESLVFGMSAWRRPQAINEYDPFPHIPFIFAQHHGIPTRYLDWTRSPTVAALFATEPSNVPRISDSLCVWATQPQETMSTQWYSTPRASHSYLHAQHGVCSIQADGENFYQHQLRWPTFDQGVEESHRLPLRKYMLPISEVVTLRQVLHQLRVSRAHLMPTLDNVAQSVQEIWNWSGAK